MNGKTVAGRSDPCAKPQAATAPSYLICDSTLASVWLPTEFHRSRPALLPQWATGIEKFAGVDDLICAKGNVTVTRIALRFVAD